MSKLCRNCVSHELGVRWNEDKTGIESMMFCKNLKLRKKHGVPTEYKKILINSELTECEFYKAKPNNKEV